MPNPIEIRDVSDPRIAQFARLTDAQMRSRLDPRKAVVIVESPKVIATALECGLEPLSLLCERKHIEGDAREIIAQCGDIPLYTGEREILAAITGYKLTRGVLCAMRRPCERRIADLPSSARRILVLDEISDSTNIGAIFRSAAALGMDAVALTPTSCDPLNRRSIRVSMGAVFRIPWIWIDDMAELSAAGFKTVAMALRPDSVSLTSKVLKAEEKLAVIMGAEGYGLSAGVIDSCDYVVKIPMAYNLDSLNVAAAAAIACWELRK